MAVARLILAFSSPWPFLRFLRCSIPTFLAMIVLAATFYAATFCTFLATSLIISAFLICLSTSLRPLLRTIFVSIPFRAFFSAALHIFLAHVIVRHFAHAIIICAAPTPLLSICPPVFQPSL